MNAEAQRVNEAAAAAPQTLVLGGRTFIVPVPTLSDFFAQRAEARRQVQESFKDPLELVNEKISAAERKGRPYSPTLIAALTAEAMKGSGSKEGKSEPSEEQLKEQLTSPGMIRWWALYLVRKADANVTAEDIAQWVPDADVYNVSAKLGRIMQLADLNPN